MSCLDELEKLHRNEAKKNLHLYLAVNPLKLCLVSAFVTPFIVAEGLFVPLLGQILACASIMITLFYLYKARSIKAILSILSGIVLAIVLLSFFGHMLMEEGLFIFYLLLGFSTAVTIGYVLWIAGVITAGHEKAAAAYEGNPL